ncbi:polysaccharide deacetylase family protein [Paenibacillus sp.]|uniref:polysaccharide deacetylase family protein n=1 Tax=Paenibacillus sp. TaxID=58172 RepID=UPI0028113C9C|nr:polysaccharide deacetylase family protein [Paenibacillus sp.]
MRNIGWIAAGLLLVAALAGCGSAGEGTDASPPPAESAAPDSVVPSEGDAETEETETAQPPQSEPEAQPKPEPEPEAETPTVEKDYYMDGSYILRPKDESDPKKVVLLTFDDGPKDEETLTSMLDTLERHRAKAIFFLNGYRAEKKPELVKLIHERGQTIGNHSWDHIDLKKEPQESMEKQIDDVQALVRDIVGQAPTFFRPPFGSGGDAVKKKAKDAGMLYMTWSNGSRDWEKGYDEPRKVIDSVLEQLHPGSNILMHELAWTDEALDELLTELEEREYGFLDPERIDPDYSKN